MVIDRTQLVIVAAETVPSHAYCGMTMQYRIPMIVFAGERLRLSSFDGWPVRAAHVVRRIDPDTTLLRVKIPDTDPD